MYITSMVLLSNLIVVLVSFSSPEQSIILKPVDAFQSEVKEGTIILCITK